MVAVENPDWAAADQLIAGISAGLSTVFAATGAQIKSQQIILAMHVQIKTKPRQEVTFPLLSPIAYKLLDGDVQLPGLILNAGKIEPRH